MGVLFRFTQNYINYETKPNPLGILRIQLTFSNIRERSRVRTIVCLCLLKPLYLFLKLALNFDFIETFKRLVRTSFDISVRSNRFHVMSSFPP